MAKLCQLLLALVVFSFAPSAAHSETLNISGLSFAVDEIARVDDSHVKLVLFGHAQIVDRARLEDVVVTEYFGNVVHTANISDKALQDFLIESIKQRKFERAGLTLSTLCVRPMIGAEEWDSFLDQLQFPGASEFLKYAVEASVSAACPAVANARIVFIAGVGDTAWVRTKAVGFALQVESDLRPYVRERIRSAGLSRSFERMSLMIDFFGAAFGIEDTEYGELRRLYQKVVEAIEDIKRGDLERIFALIDLTRGDKWLSDVISPLLVESIHSQAEAKIRRGDRDGALIALSHVDIRKRTPTTHELAKRALSEMQPTGATALFDAGTAQFLKTLSLADASVRDVYGKALDRLAQWNVQSGLLEQAQRALDQVLLVRGDPNVENDAVRLAIIQALVKRKLFVQAGQMLSDVQTSVPLNYRIKFFVSGLYFDVRYVYVLLLAPILAGLVLFIIEVWRRYRHELVKAANERIAQVSAHATTEEAPRPQFVTSSFMRSASPAMIEYREALAVFGLGPGVDLKTIKAAYRNAVKEVHPDHLGATADPSTAEKFIKLTKTYERLLELHQALAQIDTGKRT
ncbi:MAG: J domain-containing protein [Oligoflexia bacterium]|nr:J domain-containing protein [Oligoflexia bacterium]